MNARPNGAVTALNEIVQIAVDRMNSNDDVSAQEAFTLGQITATALGVAGVEVTDDDAAVSVPVSAALTAAGTLSATVTPKFAIDD